MIRNWSSAIGFIIGLASFSVYLTFLTPKQFVEVLRPKDWLTRLRWIILLILVTSILTSIPSLFYQYFRMLGHDYRVLRNLATVTSQVSRLGTTVLLVLVYTYKKKD